MPKQSTTPFTFYTFRLDIDYADSSKQELLDKLSKWIKVYFTKYAIFKEIAEKTKKPHLQGKIGLAKSLSQARKLIRDAFPGVFVGTKYSISYIENPESWDSYICKDGVEFVNNCFTADEVAKMSADYQAVKSKLQEEGKVKKELTKTFTQHLADVYIEEHTHYADLLCDLSHTQHDKEQLRNVQKHLLAFIVRRLGKTAKVFDACVLQRMYNGVKNYILHNDNNPYKNDLDKYYSYWEQFINL